jgi:AraC-like DNA-binding protein
MYVTGPGLVHAQVADEHEPMLEYCIHFEFQAELNARRRQVTWIDTEAETMLQILQETTFWFGSDDNRLIPYFEEIYQEYRSAKIGYYSIIQNFLAIIIGGIIRRVAPEQHATYAIPLKQQFEATRLLVDDYFRRYRDDLSVDDLASKISVSSRQLHRILMSYYGKGFCEYLLERRLLAACELLEAGQLSMTEVASACGFGSVDWFRRCFFEQYKQNPSAWAMQHRKKRH